MRREAQIEAYSFVPIKHQRDHYLSAQMMQEGILSLLWRNDRMGMIHSIEARFPFLSETIVHFSMNLPLQYKIGRIGQFYNFKHPFLIDKAIVRKTAKKYLPKELYLKKKDGFPTYGLREMKIKPDFFHRGTAAALLGLDNKQIEYMCRSFKPYHIALLASFEVWAKMYIEKQSQEATHEHIQRFVSI